MENIIRLCFRARSASAARSTYAFQTCRSYAVVSFSKRRKYSSGHIESHANANQEVDLLGASGYVTSPKGDQDQQPIDVKNDSGNLERKTRANAERKAQTAFGVSPIADRSAVSPQEPLIDAKYIQQHLYVPSQSDYPAAPASIFDRKNVSGRVNDLFKKFGLQIREDLSAIGTIKKPTFRCTLTAPLLNNEEEKATGQAQSKKDAARIAYLHLLAKLHKSQALHGFFQPEETHNPPKMRTAGDRVAKVDVYNYLARRGLIPEYTIRKIPSRQKSRAEVSIKLEALNIYVSAAGPSVDFAEIAASRQFKHEAEKMHAQHTKEPTNTMDLDILNTDNMQQFIRFYDGTHRKDDFKVDLAQSADQVTGDNIFEAQALLNESPLGKPVTSKDKVTALKLGFLVGAVHLTQETPALLKQFKAALELGNGLILAPVSPVHLNLTRPVIQKINDTLGLVSELGVPEEDQTVSTEERTDGSRRFWERPKLSHFEITTKNQQLEENLQSFILDPKLKTLRDKKDSLPMNQHRLEILKHVNKNAYSVIVGATGSGKTTQVPQILFDNAISEGQGAMCNVVCTQPRRIAATSVARRVAEERNEALQDTVGYQVRFDSKLPRPGGSITYCTTGVLLQQLQRASDKMLDTISHIIVDEVHERDLPIDFLMLTIKQTVEARRAAGKSVPRVVLMSATIDSELFAGYFKIKTRSGSFLQCPSLSIPGRTFPVAEKFLETIIDELEEENDGDLSTTFQGEKDTLDYMEIERKFRADNGSVESALNEEVKSTIDWKSLKTGSADSSATREKEDAIVPIALVAATVAHISKSTDEGAVLVFLPGLDEIRKVKETLLHTVPLGVDFSNTLAFKIFQLHSSVPAADQADVFNPVPKGCRKIILSTNIAETSVTIPDIQYVVDTGKQRESRYDQVRRITSLQCTWISKSNAKQRAGRAGRVQNGNYYALYSKRRYDSLRSIGLPEILRSDLQELCLDVKAQAFKMPVRDFLAAAIEPPQPSAVNISIENLEALGAFTSDEKLTALGRLLANLPVHPALGKMIVLGIIFRCLDPMIILGAALNERTPFITPLEQREQATKAHHQFAEGTGSDHIGLINAIRAVRQVEATRNFTNLKEFCIEHFLHYGCCRNIGRSANEIEEVLVDAGLIPFLNISDRFEGEIGHPSLNTNAKSVSLIKALALSGLHPNLGVTVGIPVRTQTEKAAMVHPSSVNSRITKTSGNASEGPRPKQLLTYSVMQKSNDGNLMFLRDTTLCTPLTSALFGGHLKMGDEGTIKMDGWLPFSNSGIRGGIECVMELKEVMDILLAAAFQSMSKIKARSRNRRSAKWHALPEDYDNGDHRYLADDETREAFGAGLVEVLNLDAKNNEPSSDSKEGF